MTDSPFHSYKRPDFGHLGGTTPCLRHPKTWDVPRAPARLRVLPCLLAAVMLVGCGDKPADAVLISRHCWIDSVNAAATEEISVDRGPLKITGWVADSTSGVAPEKANLQLLNTKGNIVSSHLIVTRIERPDVVEVNKQPGYAKSGFEITVDLTKTPPANYALSLAMQREGASLVCESSKKIVLK